MPKKFQGENSKSAEARARKETQKVDEKVRKEQEKEDAYWQDDDKNLQKKLQRKDERDKKKQEQTDRKQATKALLEKEMEQIGGKSLEGGSSKVTQAEIAAQQEHARVERQKIEDKARLEAKKIVAEEARVVEENVNRMKIEGEEARTVEDALRVLGDTSLDDVDRHPERRVKAAYAAYEERNMPILKAENPNMRLSQLRQLLKKEWQRSPENPMNKI